MSDKYEIFLDGGHHVVLGRGGGGAVYKYRVKATQTTVAVKELGNFGISIQKRREEIETWKKIKNHPNVVSLLDSWEEGEVIRAVMPLALGSLESLVFSLARAQDNSDVGDVIFHDSQMLLNMSMMVLEGMSHLHNSSPAIIHRDLKPQNILYFLEQGRIVLKIADFGISKSLEGTMNAQTHDIGTAEFQAPEVLQCSSVMLSSEKYSTEVDLWSLGLVLHFLVMAELPPFKNFDTFTQENIDNDFDGEWFGDPLYKNDRTVEKIKNITKGMLVLDKNKRISVDEALLKMRMDIEVIIIISLFVVCTVPAGPGGEPSSGLLSAC